MDRRSFLRRAAIVASGAIAADQLDLIDRLGWVRRLFTTGGWRRDPWLAHIDDHRRIVTTAEWDSLLKEVYSSHVLSIHRQLEALGPQFSGLSSRRLLTPAEVYREFGPGVDRG